MRITILTLFPSMFSGPFDYSVVARILKKNVATIKIVNLREFGIGKHKSVDDRPYGGGSGMILRVDVVDRAIQSVLAHDKNQKSVRTILLDPQGTLFTQQKAVELSRFKHMVLICGHYEGVDDRLRSRVDEEISIGNYILTGGEIPAMVVVDSVIRLLQGVFTKSNVTSDDSFASVQHPLLEYPQFTLPRVYNGLSVPDVLLSGNHKDIASWKYQQSKKRTQDKRPDVMK